MFHSALQTYKVVEKLISFPMLLPPWLPTTRIRPIFALVLDAERAAGPQFRSFAALRH